MNQPGVGDSGRSNAQFAKLFECANVFEASIGHMSRTAQFNADQTMHAREMPQRVVVEFVAPNLDYRRVIQIGNGLESVAATIVRIYFNQRIRSKSRNRPPGKN